MKLQFKIQPFQTEAVESVANVFSGQPNMASAEYTIDQGVCYITVGGRRVRDSQQTLGLVDIGHRNADVQIDSSQLLENHHKVQDAHGIQRSKTMDKGLGCCQLDIEKAKIACAKKLFETLLAYENVTYDMVNGYGELWDIVTK